MINNMVIYNKITILYDAFTNKLSLNHLKFSFSENI